MTPVLCPHGAQRRGRWVSGHPQSLSPQWGGGGGGSLLGNPAPKPNLPRSYPASVAAAHPCLCRTVLKQLQSSCECVPSSQSHLVLWGGHPGPQWPTSPPPRAEPLSSPRLEEKRVVWLSCGGSWRLAAGPHPQGGCASPPPAIATLLLQAPGEMLALREPTRLFLSLFQGPCAPLTSYFPSGQRRQDRETASQSQQGACGRLPGPSPGQLSASLSPVHTRALNDGLCDPRFGGENRGPERLSNLHRDVQRREMEVT